MTNATSIRREEISIRREEIEEQITMLQRLLQMLQQHCDHAQRFRGVCDDCGHRTMRGPMAEEAMITVNGQTCSYGEAMTIRVAISSFASELSENGLGKDKVGEAICTGYLKSVNSIYEKMGLT